MAFDSKALADEVRANHTRLESCDAHDFEGDKSSVVMTLTNGRPWFKRYVCNRCGGTIDSYAHSWYQTGLMHGKMERT